MSRSPDVADELVRMVGEGSTFAGACRELGVSVQDWRNRLAQGRRGQGPYADFARRLDAARATAAEPADGDDEPVGPVEAELELLIASRELDGEGRLAAEQARALARQVDRLAASGQRGGQALAAVSRRLDELVDRLTDQRPDAIELLRQRIAAKREQ